MTNWERLSPSPSSEDWSRILAGATDRNHAQSRAWGEFKRASRWEPECWVGTDGSGRKVACLQALWRRLPLGGVVGWVPGGPVTGFVDSDVTHIDDYLAAWLEASRRERPVVYVRVRSHQPHSPGAAYGLSRQWQRPRRKIDSGFTTSVDLDRPFDEVWKDVASKHRYYARQAAKAQLNWRHALGGREGLIEDMAAVYRQMVALKQLGRGDFGVDNMLALNRAFSDESLVLVGYLGGIPVTACMVHVLAGQAFYLLAATGPSGREVSAAYAMVFELFKILQARGIERLDFGGIDPTSPSASGVDHFKRGFGGKIVEYLGEWEWTTSRAVCWAVNIWAGRLHGPTEGPGTARRSRRDGNDARG